MVKLEKNTLYHLLKATAENYPNSVAQYYKPDGKNYSPITYSELYHNVKALSLSLMIKLKIKKGENIGLIADCGHRWLSTSMSIVTIGAVDVPRGTDATVEDLRYILNHSLCRVLFLEHVKVFEKIKKYLKEFKKLKQVIFLDIPEKMPKATGIQFYNLSDLIAEGSEKLENAKEEKKYHDKGSKVKPDDLLTIVYTSGTTGKPKGVMLTHDNLVFDVDSALDGIGFSTDDRTMAYLPPWHIAERLVETVAARAGGSVAFTGVASLAQDLAQIKPTILLSVPRVWESFYNKVIDKANSTGGLIKKLFYAFINSSTKFHEAISELKNLNYKFKKPSFFDAIISKTGAAVKIAALFLPSRLAYAAFGKIRKGLGGEIRFALSGAGALPEHIDRFFNAIGVPIVEAYGMTEVSGISTKRDLDRIIVGTLGRTINGVEIRLRDERGRVIKKPGVKGIAWHKGRNVMKGYYKEKKKTSEILQNGWLNSGDLLMYTIDGSLKFAGRAKDTIVLLGGENIEPEPIEFALNQSPFIVQTVVVGQDKKSLCALILPSAESFEKYFKDKNVLVPENLKALAGNTEVKAVIRAEIKNLVSGKTGFKSFERIINFTLISKPFEIGDELTQTMKIRRNVVFDKYEKEIEAMY